MTDLPQPGDEPAIAEGRQRQAFSRWRSRARHLQWLVYLLGLAGLITAAVSTRSELDGQDLPSLPVLALATALLAGGLVAGGHGFSALFGRRVPYRHQLRRALYVSQLSKYLPAGGVVQVLGQISYAGRAAGRGGTARAAVATPLVALAQVSAGTVIAGGLVLRSDLPAWTRSLALAGAMASPLLMIRRPLAWALDAGRSRWARVPESSLLPPQRDLWRCWLWMASGMATQTASFTVLLGAFAPGGTPWSAVPSFAAAWVLGFLVLPLPAGVGLREVLLIALLPGLGTATVVAAAVAHRLSTLVAEIAVVAAHLLTTGSRRVPPEPAATE